jgi:hypothetical protein
MPHSSTFFDSANLKMVEAWSANFLMALSLKKTSKKSVASPVDDAGPLENSQNAFWET